MKIHEYKTYDINTTITNNDADFVFLKIDDAPFKIYGAHRERDRFVRIPSEIAEKAGGNVLERYTNTAGGRIRFVTDSNEVILRVTLDSPKKSAEICDLSDFTMSGMDIYANERYKGTAKPRNIFGDNTYEFQRLCGDSGLPTITLYMPTFNGIKDVYVGLKAGSVVYPAPDYAIKRPVVFYGGTITQGAAPLRGGTSYSNLLMREFDCDYLNLGFACGAHAEKEISDYISGLDMSALVYDLDDPMISPEELSKIHERMFLEFRKKQPDTPVLFLSRPYGSKPCQDVAKCRDIVKRTYENAIARGDKNVWMVLGSDFFPNQEIKENFSVDDTYPSDLATYFMKEAIKPVLREILEKVK